MGRLAPTAAEHAFDLVPDGLVADPSQEFAPRLLGGGGAVEPAHPILHDVADVAFLAGANGQTGPNMGADEGGLIAMHMGFNGSIGNPAATPMNILGGLTASGATIDATLGDFTRNQGDVLIARITVVPEPTCVLLAIIGVLGLCFSNRGRRRRSQGVA